MRREILWFSVPACAAVGIGLWLLRKKAGNRPEQNEHNRGAAVPPVTNQKTASYSFISGFRNATTVELSFPYDADRFSYTVCEEGFLAESGDSHVGITTMKTLPLCPASWPKSIPICHPFVSVLWKGFSIRTVITGACLSRSRMTLPVIC